MYIIADSSSTRTEWIITEGTQIIEHAITSGINPFFMSRREISHVIRLELPEIFFKHRWQHVYFYGAGCANPEKNKTVESSLIAQFKTPSSVFSDLLGAARGMLLNNRGLVAILSTGANSCLYDGKDIIKNVRSGGYILGDEGSNSYLGKLLLSDIIKDIAPREIIEAFYESFETTPDDVMDQIYSQPQTSRSLADFSFFLAEHIKHPYCHDMVYEAFMTFFKRNIAYYDYKNLPLAFVGSTGMTYTDILNEAAEAFGIKVGGIMPSSIPGLVDYHAKN